MLLFVTTVNITLLVLCVKIYAHYMITTYSRMNTHKCAMIIVHWRAIMTVEISFGNAMVAYEKGKTVQYYSDIKWFDFCDKLKYNFPDLVMCKWRIKPEPVKYSVDVWLDKVPVIDRTDGTLGRYLVGDIRWSEKELEGFKKYSITVEDK